VGITDRLKGLRKKAEDTAAEHKEQLEPKAGITTRSPRREVRSRPTSTTGNRRKR